MADEKHPLFECNENERIDYLCVVASIASVDGNTSDDEILNLRKICKSVKISSKGIGTVIAAAENPVKTDIAKTIKALASSKLRFTLLTDLILLCYADDNYSKKEHKEIERIASKLNIKEDQVVAMENYAKAILKAQKSGNTAEDLTKLGGDVAAGLASAGIPIAAVAVSGSVFGLSAAGMASGLAALGLGLGMATGIGAVAVIGVGSYFAVRWLYKQIAGA